MDQTTTDSEAASQSKRLQQVQPQSSGSDNESGRSDNIHAQQQSTPPRQTRLATGQKPQQQAQQQTPQKAQKVHDLSQQPQKPASSTTARPKGQKHVVGGTNSTARLHARVPSSKALHKAGHHHHPNNHLHHASSTSSAKLSQQQLQQLQQIQQLQQQQHKSQHHRRRSSGSPSPSDYAERFPFAAVPSPAPIGQSYQQQQQRPQLHRRSTSGNETKLQRSVNSSSASSLVRRNVSTTSLKRNKSHADVAKRMSQGHTRSAAILKRTNSNPAVNNDRSRSLSSPNKKPAGQVHFEIGSPDAQDDEWVDAGSSNVSGSRKNSLQYREDNKATPQQKLDSEEEEEEEEEEEDEEDISIRSTNSSGPQPSPPVKRDDSSKVAPPSSSPSTSPGLHLRTGSTSHLLLPRTPPRGAPPKISTETVAATHTMPSSSSPDSEASLVLHRQQQSLPSSNGDREAMTSRFISTGSHESTSGATNGGSFYTTSSSRPSTGRNLLDDRDASRSSNGASASNSATSSHPRRTRSIGGDTSLITDDESSGAVVNKDGRHPRRTRAGNAPPAELSRTQQKLNLERASSSIDRSNRQHQGPAAGPLLGAGESGMHDPRIGKLMERTGMEYYVVRRYQNPVTRSLNRLTGRLSGDKNWRIPSTPGISRAATGLSTNSNGVPVVGRGPTRPSSAGAGLSQSFRERDIRRDVLQSATAAAAGNTGADSADPSGLSHSKAMTADNTAALLRNLWDKNLYLGTSQD